MVTLTLDFSSFFYLYDYYFLHKYLVKVSPRLLIMMQIIPMSKSHGNNNFSLSFSCTLKMMHKHSNYSDFTSPEAIFCISKKR